MTFLCVQDVQGMVFSYLQKAATRDYCVLVGITAFTFTDKMYLCTVTVKVLELLLIEYRAPFHDIFNFEAWIFREILIA